MTLFNASDRRFAEALSQLIDCNPFLPQRFALERAALGDEYETEETAVWSRDIQWGRERPNVQRLTRRAEKLAEHTRKQLGEGVAAKDAELALYEDLALYVLYYRFLARLTTTADNIDDTRERVALWPDFLEDFGHFFQLGSVQLPNTYDPAHIFACLFQIRRAFWHIFDFIIGESMPIAELRAAVWQSIFTHDMRRYRTSLYNRMADITTLITGPSGTGKELVARAIGLSQYIAFDAKRARFVGDTNNAFLTLNLSALSPTLIESELFGHRKGAFTGAVVDRAGWLEMSPRHGSVFLDEIGELDPAIQVKLLRVVQSRTFQRLGETDERQFLGKIIAATNRDLTTEIHAGRFREDFYYRLCSDQIHTASLAEQLAESPLVLRTLVTYITQRVVGEDATDLIDEVESWIRKHLADYDWPGNIRELEQCVRNIMIRGSYAPPRKIVEPDEAEQRWLADAEQGRLSADELVAHYCRAVYNTTGTYEATARSLKLDRRTVKSKIASVSEADAH